MARNVIKLAEWSDAERYHGFKPPRRAEDWSARLNLYLVRADDYVKIGVASDVYRRVNGMRAGCPFPMSIISVRTLPRVLAYQVERRVHQHFADSRVHGEWFQLDVAEAKQVISLQISRAKLAMEKWIRDGYREWEPR